MTHRKTGSAALTGALALILTGAVWTSSALAQSADQKAPQVEGQQNTPQPAPSPMPSDKAPMPPSLQQIPPGDLIDASEWREMFSGKTLTYESAAGLIGREYYVPGGDRVIFVYYDGRCFDGSWIYDSGYYCFEYDGFYCFQHFRRNGEIMVREQDGGEQTVTDISDEILSCKPDLLSRAEDAPAFNALASFRPVARPRPLIDIENEG